MANDASRGVGNSSAQTVGDHALVNGRVPASEALREGWSEAKVCAEEVAAPLEPMRGRFSAEAAPAASRSSYRQGRRKAPSGRATCRTSTIGTSNVPNQQHRDAHPANQQHREEHFLSNNGAKWAGVEGVRGSNLACFLKNFVSNYIVIFLMMLFRVHL